MKKSVFCLSRFLIIPLIVFSLGWFPVRADAQDTTYAESNTGFTEAELAQMLAPIALYPDALLAQILMASTYPIEVIEADRWIGNNQGLTGDALDEALLGLDWDPSVKALCHFPSVLALMSERIGETTDLGNAFLAQEAEVMAMVQRLRAEAFSQGHLYTNSQQTVVVDSGTIIIEPANPAVVYVPYYDPFYVYGSWWYPAYPPYYWGPAGTRPGIRVFYWPETYFSFSFGAWSYFDWRRHYIHIDVHRRPRFVRHDHWIVRSDRWKHAPRHRRGVSYHNRSTAQKFGQATRHISRFRHDGDRFPERIKQERNAGRRGARDIRLDQNRHRTERSRLDNQRRKLQRAERIRQVRDRSDRKVRDLATSDHSRQGRSPVDNRRQIRERPVREQQKRTILNRVKRERQPAAPVRQVRERSGRERMQAEPDLRRPMRKTVENNRQVHKRSVREPTKRTIINRVKRDRQQVNPARKIRERQQVKTADRNTQKRKTAVVERRSGASGQFSNRSGSGAGQRIKTESVRSGREQRSSGSRATSRSGDGRRQGRGGYR